MRDEATRSRTAVPEDPGARPPPWVRLASLAVLAAIAIFVAVTGLAMQRYRGGNWFDKHAVTHDFWLNFLCDLTREIGVNGQPSRSATLGQVGLVTILLALFPFWLILPRYFPHRPRLGMIVRIAGLTSSTCALLVPMVPSDRVGDLHGYLVVLAAGPGVAAFTGGVIGLFLGRRTPPWLLVVASVLLLISAVDASLFTYHVVVVNTPHPLLAILQRLSAMLLVTLMIGLSLPLINPRAAQSPPMHASSVGGRDR